MSPITELRTGRMPHDVGAAADVAVEAVNRHGVVAPDLAPDLLGRP